MAGLETIETYLKEKWRLKYKPCSRRLMPCAGAPEWLDLQGLGEKCPGWIVEKATPCLGTVLSYDGSSIPCFMQFRQQALGAAMRSLSGPSARRMSAERRLHLLNRAVGTMLDYRNTRWAASRSLLKMEDALQRRLIMMAQRTPRRPAEEMSTWAARRSRAAGELARRQGLWSRRHVRRCSEWQDHCERRRNWGSPCARALAFQNAQWRAERRVAQGSASAAAGRLNSRVLTHVQQRWEDAWKRAVE